MSADPAVAMWEQAHARLNTPPAVVETVARITADIAADPVPTWTSYDGDTPEPEWLSGRESDERADRDAQNRGAL